MDGSGIVGGYDALFGQHRRMGPARSNVLPVEVPIEVDGGIDLLHDGVWLFAETPAPDLVAHDLTHRGFTDHDRS